MTEDYPRGVCVSASSLSPEASLTALWSASPGRRVLQGHADYASIVDAESEHRVDVRWEEPVSLARLRVAWPAARPLQVRAVALLAGGDERVLEADVASEPLVSTWRLDGGAVTGVAIIQDPGGGPPSHPDVLRIAALSVQTGGTPPLGLAVERRQGEPERPTMPLYCDGDPDSFIDASDAVALVLSAPPGVGVTAIEVDLLRLGAVAGLPWLSRWLSDPDLIHSAAGVLPCRRLVDTSRIGVVAGLVALRLELNRPSSEISLRLALPTGAPSPLAVARAWIGGLAGVASNWQQAEEVKVRPHMPAVPVDIRGLGRKLLAAGHLPAERAIVPGGGVSFSCSLGVPLTDGRASVANDGGVVVQWQDARDRCLHLGLALDGRRLSELDGVAPARTLDRVAPILRLGW